MYSAAPRGTRPVKIKRFKKLERVYFHITKIFKQRLEVEEILYLLLRGKVVWA
jgi:hypothetical protein